MIKVGITGQAGFIGTHLYNLIGTKTNFERIDFQDNFFEDESKLQKFVKKCDVIVHLAAMNRHEDENVIYKTNISLVEKLILALEKEKVTPHIIFSSSSQERIDNLYGKSKLEGRKLFEKWARKNSALFTGLVIPNVFGPYGKPFYNSFIATFCHLLNNNKNPEIQIDNEINLIYVGSLCEFILKKIQDKTEKIEVVQVPHDFTDKVSQILIKLKSFKELYLEKGIIPVLKDRNEINLFNTFCSFIDFSNYFPVNLTKHSDERGSFVEVIKLGIGGQVSFSTTKQGITRGNHYHTRKIERFAVIKGKALIQLRKIGSSKVLNFYLDGEKPSYVDMPVWYTHNITNIGEEELYTLFWINEWYNPEDTDTFFEKV